MLIKDPIIMTEMKNINKLLIIEDGVDIQEFLEAYFSPMAEIVQAFTEEEARAKFSPEAGFTHIIIDGNLDKIKNPGKNDTIDLAIEIRKKFKGIMIAISGNEDYNQALKLAGCDYSILKEDCCKMIKDLLI